MIVRWHGGVLIRGSSSPRHGVGWRRQRPRRPMPWVAMKRAEEAYDAANDRFEAAERAERAREREARYAARQAHARAITAVERLTRRVRELSEHLGRMELTRPEGSRYTEPPRWCGPAAARCRSTAGSGSCPLRRRCTARPCAGSGKPRAAARRSPAPARRTLPAGQPARPRSRPVRAIAAAFSRPPGRQEGACFAAVPAIRP
jgi:hypothetical protein